MRQKYPSNLAHSDGNRASRRSLATRAQSGLCRPICADYSAHKLHARCAVHRGCMRAAGICWIAPGKPPLVAYVCGNMLIVRSDRDYNPERAPLAARHDATSYPCVCAELGGRVRSWATAAAPHSVAYQLLPDWLHGEPPMRTLSMACGLCMVCMIRSTELPKAAVAQAPQGPVSSARVPSFGDDPLE